MRRVALILGVVATLALAPVADAATRHYWIQAEPVMWNVVPSGRDPMTGQTFSPADTTFQAVVFRAYTRNWRRPLGAAKIPGPLVRARVGDTVLVHFRNMDTAYARPHSMHFHGFRYGFFSDGSFVPGVSTGRGTNVRPGQSFTYRLAAVRSSVGVWPYHDHGPQMVDSIASGLYGASSILGRRERRADREFVVFFNRHLGFQTFNGRAFVGNTPTFRSRTGETVQWDVLALGDEFHNFHLHGHRWRGPGGELIDTRELGPGESFRFRIREDVTGPWLYHCHVEFHMVNGMMGLYRVSRARRASAAVGIAGR